MDKAIIHIDKLYKKYNHADRYAIEDLSLKIKEGEIFGLLGPNGAGKTTLLSILFGLIKASSGDFTINNLRYSKNAKDIKSLIGVVPQEYALYPSLTAKENLLFFGSMYGLKGDVLKYKIDTYLKYLEIDHVAKKRLSTFSGGMKRRVNLIAGILHKPSILFLDEPTVGVDVLSKKLILRFLAELNKENTTIIYTSHHLAEAQDFCHRIGFLNDGTLYACDTPFNLIAQTQNASNLEDVFVALSSKNNMNV